MMNRFQSLRHWPRTLGARVVGGARTWWRRETLWLAPGTDALAARPEGGPAESVLHGPDPAAMLADWAQWCADHPGQRCRLALSGHWVWATVLPTRSMAVQPALRVAEAQAMWGEALGWPAERLDQDAVWRALPASEPPLVCAMPATLLGALQAEASRHGISLEGVGPWWLAAAQRWWQHTERAPDHSPSAIWQAREPGLITHFRHSSEGDDRPTLSVWSERVDGQHVTGPVGTAPGADVVRDGDIGPACRLGQSSALAALVLGGVDVHASAEVA